MKTLRAKQSSPTLLEQAYEDDTLLIAASIAVFFSSLPSDSMTNFWWQMVIASVFLVIRFIFRWTIERFMWYPGEFHVTFYDVND